MRAPLFAALLLLSSFAGAVAACTSTTTTEEVVTGDAGAAKADGSSSSDASSKADAGGPSTPGPTGDEACAAEATLDACGECCITNHQEGAKVISDAVLACACAEDAGTICQNQCASTACNDPPSNPDQACATCLQGTVGQGGACLQAASTACQKNADCMAEQQCISKCPSN